MILDTGFLILDARYWIIFKQIKNKIQHPASIELAKLLAVRKQFEEEEKRCSTS
jgi:hypothetical protein